MRVGKYMALIKCPECGQEISDTAKSCPHCGYKTEKMNPEKMVKYKKITSILICIGIAMAVIGLGWSSSTADKRLALRAGYQFGSSVTESEWLAYQRISNIQSFICNSGVVLFVSGIIGKIIIKIKGR